MKDCPSCQHPNSYGNNCKKCNCPLQATPEIIRLHQRNMRNSRYLIEDFENAKNKLNGNIYICALLCGCLAISMFFLGRNLGHLILTGLMGVAFYLAYEWGDWNEKMYAYTGIGLTLSIVFLEWLIFGLPDPLVRGLVVYDSSTGRASLSLLRLANELTPFLYLGLKIGMIYPFIAILNTKAKLDKTAILIHTE